MSEQLSTGSPLSETWHANTSFIIQQFHKTSLLKINTVNVYPNIPSRSEEGWELSKHDASYRISQY